MKNDVYLQHFDLFYIVNNIHRSVEGELFINLKLFFMECKEITFKERLSETGFLDELDFSQEFKLYVDCPTSGGKSYYILNYLKEREIKAVFVVDTINLAKQLSAQYQIPYYTAEHREDIDANLIITIQHHIPKFESRETVIIDEAHTLITEYNWKRETIEEVMTSLEYYKRIIFLSGTPLISDDSIFKGMKLIKARKEQPDQRVLAFVEYENLAGGVIDLCLHAKAINKIPVVSLLDKSSLLPKVVKELKKRGFNRIAEINSETKVIKSKKNGKEEKEEEDNLVVNNLNEGDKTDYLSQLINDCRIDADVILTTYTQGYSLLGQDYLLIIALGKNQHSYVNIVQMMNRFREDTNAPSFILTNAEYIKEGDKGIYNFPEVFDYLKEEITKKTRKRIEELNKVAKSTRTLKRQLKLLANECDQYISVTREVNHQSIAFKAFQLINHAMHEQLYKMSKILHYYNIELMQLSCSSTTKIERGKENKKEDTEMKKKEIMEEIDLFYKSKEPMKGFTCMGKEIMPLVDKTDKSSTRYKIEETYNELSSLGLTDEEIRDIQEKNLHAPKKMSQIIKAMKIRYSTDPIFITYRALLLSEFKIGENLTGVEITERMNKVLEKNKMTKQGHNNAIQLFRLLFDTKENVNKERRYEIIKTF